MAGFPLMADGEDLYPAALTVFPIQRGIAAFAVGDDEFAPSVPDGPADARVPFKDTHGVNDQVDDLLGECGVDVGDEVCQSIDIGFGAGRKNNQCHARCRDAFAGAVPARETGASTSACGRVTFFPVLRARSLSLR
ncbi:hypothetical protein BH11PSE13_BH11PSE13_26150 [soil metagenome]